MTPDSRITVIFIGHGSRRKESNEELATLVSLFKKRHPRYRTVLCFIELAKPSFNQTILWEAAREECQKIILLPVFLFSSRHVKNDIPLVGLVMALL